MPRAPDPLEQRGDGARRAHVAHQFHVPDVNAQLQGRGGHHHRHFRGLELLLGLEPRLARQAAVVGQHLAFPQPVGELVRHPFHQPARVHEDQGGAVGLDLFRDAVIDLGPQRMGGDGTQFLVRHVDGEVEFPLVPYIDDGASGRFAAPQPPGPHQQAGDVVHGLLGGAQPDPLQGLPGQRVQPFQGKREMGPPLVSGHRVDLVHDDGVGALEYLSAALGREQDVEGFRRGDEYVRGPGDHALPLRRGGVAGAHRGADVRQRQSFAPARTGDLGQGFLQVLLDVVAQGLQRRDVHHAGVVMGLFRVRDELVDGPQEGRQGLPRAGGRGDERVPAPGDLLPAGSLGRSGPAEAGPEPVAHQRMKFVDHWGNRSRGCRKRV